MSLRPPPHPSNREETPVSMYGSFIVPMTLATPAEYASWAKTTAPANIAAILRSCTSIVLDATQGTIYDVDPLSGIATSPAVKDALRDATCIQASAWAALGIDPTTGGIAQSSKTVKSKRLGSGAIEYSDNEVKAVTQARAAAYTSLVPEAVRFLQQRNLLGTDPVALG